MSTFIERFNNWCKINKPERKCEIVESIKNNPIEVWLDKDGNLSTKEIATSQVINSMKITTDNGIMYFKPI